MKKQLSLVSKVTMLATLLTSLSACAGGDSGSAPSGGAPNVASVSSLDGKTDTRANKTQVLLYNGDGSANGEPQVNAEVLEAHGVPFRKVTSEELNEMSTDDLAAFGLILWPGGSATTMSESLTSATRARLREAVVNRGVSFLGICAGAWMAVGPEPASGQGAEWGLALATGEILEIYEAPGAVNEAAMTPQTFASGAKHDLVFWGGPVTPAWTGGVVARYADGKPSVSQTVSGNGYILLSAAHPDAPANWRDWNALDDSDGIAPDHELLWQMIQAGLTRTPMPAFQ